MSNFQLTAQQAEDYNRDGYLIVRNFLSRDEVAKLQTIAVEDDAMRKHSFDLNDQAGKKNKTGFMVHSRQ